MDIAAKQAHERACSLSIQATSRPVMGIKIIDGRLVSHDAMERIGKVSESDRSFDLEFWQRQGSNAIFGAAWGMVAEAWRWKGRDESELEFQRSVECLKPLRG